MNNEIVKLLEKHKLSRLKNILAKYMLPSIAFDLVTYRNSSQKILSKLGGDPDLPDDFVWFKNKGRQLEFILQFDCSEIAKFDKSNLLPKHGLMSFFAIWKTNLGVLIQKI